MNQAILSVGSNIDPEQNCRKAEAILAQEHRLVGQSRYILTKPVGISGLLSGSVSGSTNQDIADFLNGAYCVETALDFGEFNGYLKVVEQRLGRVKTVVKSRSQPIDLDIIFWNGELMRPKDYQQDHVRLVVDELLATHPLK